MSDHDFHHFTPFDPYLERVKMKNNLFYFVKYREKQASYTTKLITASQFLSVYLCSEYLECA